MTSATRDATGGEIAAVRPWARRTQRRRRIAARLAELRTVVVGVDPGLARLRLASVAIAAMVLAAGITALVRTLFAPAEPVALVLFGGVLAMISNLTVNESELGRRRVTTALLLAPALASTVAGTLLSPYRVVADVVFVAVMMAAVWVRRYGPRGFALGMCAFMPFFFTQFLHVQVAQLPWLLVAVPIGIGSTLLLRGFVFAERPERTLRRLVAAFRARAHGLVIRVDDVLAEVAEHTGEPGGAPVPEAAMNRLRRARTGLNETALLVEDQLEQTTAGRVWPGLDNEVLVLRIFDAELALERLAVSTARMVRGPDAEEADQRPDRLALVALRAGLDRLLRALVSGTRHDAILEASSDARSAVAGLVADTRPGHERVQRAAFAVRRVADAINHAQRDAPAASPATAAPTAHRGGFHLRRHDSPAGAHGSPAGAHDSPTGPHDSPTGPHDDHDDVDHRSTAGRRVETDPVPDDDGRGRAGEGGDDGGGAGSHAREISLATRQAVQVGVGTSVAIVLGELISSARWYWAVIAAFVIFANTQSRGDLLTRGTGRIVGTIGGVLAGMGLGVLVSGNEVASLVLLFVCAFLALYLVRVSPAMLAFWITAVLALVYGLIGQFSVGVFVARVEETAAGVLASVLAAFLVLPRGTRAAFGEAVDTLVDRVDEVLDGSVEEILGRRPATRPLERARDMDDALADLRVRTEPLTTAILRRRGRSSYQRGLRVLVGCDHYARSIARLAGEITDPRWADTLRPAADQVRYNLDALRDLLVRGHRRSDSEQVLAHSAERQVDAAEAYAARVEEPRRRGSMLAAARMLRRIDQAVVGLAVDLGAADDTERDQGPSSAESASLVNTRSGS